MHALLRNPFISVTNIDFDLNHVQKEILQSTSFPSTSLHHLRRLVSCAPMHHHLIMFGSLIYILAFIRVILLLSNIKY